MTPTPALSSLTVRSTFLGLGLGWGAFIDGSPEHTATAWIMMILSTLFAVVTIYGRMRAEGPVTFRRVAEDVAKDDQSGMARLDVVLTLAAVASVIALLFAAMTSGGCGTAHLSDTDPRPHPGTWDPGPPCHIVVQTADGDPFLNVDSPGTCDPQVSRRWLCRRWRAALGPGEVQPLACAGVQP